MEKVICDVCGTDYPETATQCPICGCARGDGGQTTAGNTAAEGESSGYTYTKGGRFSKANVRKRLKAAQIQQIPEPEPEQDPDDYEDYDEEDDEEYEPASNWGLIAIVVLLLLAIIAVSSYIAIVHFDLLGTGAPKVTEPIGTTQSAGNNESTEPSGSTGVQVPCTGLTVVDGGITLKTINSTWQLNYTAEPANTTDKVIFASSDESVATVNATGLVKAVGDGEATITISCGAFVSECRVVCDLDSGTDDPTQPSDPVVPPVVLKLNRTDFTLNKKGSSWNVYSGELNPADITWTSDNEQIATITNGKVVAVGIGTTNVHAEYQGQKVSCIVRCKWVEETKPTEPVDPSTPVDPSEPSKPAATYEFWVGTMKKPQDADITISIDEGYDFKIIDSESRAIMQVEWTASKDGICTIEGRKVTGKSAGMVTLTATYDGQTFTCIVRVKG